VAANKNQKLAALIDADNAQASIIQELLAEVLCYGPAPSSMPMATGLCRRTCMCGARQCSHHLRQRS